MIDFNLAGRQSGSGDVIPFEDPERRRDRIKAEMRRRIRDLVRYLYPSAIFHGADARIGDVAGTPGGSLSIALDPIDKAGMWIDHATGDKGDVLELWARAQGFDARSDFSRALSECEAWIGGAPPAAAEARRADAVARKARAPRQTKELEEVYAYCTPDGLKICEVRRYRQSDGRKTFIPFVEDRPEMPKRNRPLYGQERWADGPIILVEGEKCADSLMMIGLNATTAMGGANTTIEKTDWTPLAGRTVILWPDADEPGRLLMDRIEGPLKALGCTVRRLAPPPGKPQGWDAADAVAEGFDITGFLAAPPEPPKPGLPVLDVAGLLTVPDPRWIVDQWIVDDGVSVFYGAAKTYKTFNVLDLALSIATGTPWRNLPTLQVPVLYLLGEGMGTFKYRVHVWLQKRSEGRTALFWTIPVGVPLSTQEGLGAALNAIAGLSQTPGLIVIDTLNRHFGPGDENASQDMTRFVQAIDQLRAATRAHICIVHHSGKDGDRGARGSSVLLGAVDNEFRVTRTEGTRICTIECTAARHADEPPAMTVEMVKVEGVHPESGVVMESLLPVLREDLFGDLNSPADAPSETAALVLASLRTIPKTVQELGEELSLSRVRVQNVLAELKRNKKVFASQDGRRNVWHVFVDTRTHKQEENQ